MPTVYGESIVIRLSDQRAGPPSIEAIGIYHEDVEFMRETIDGLNGLFLVTGPTGSGKSHTLYAMLNEAARNPINVMTVEDPVEQDVEGCLQVEVSEAEGYSFPIVLRHLLRHDPDVVMVGEIRDEETATMMNRIALSGHLAMSTLHSRETSSVPERVMDMGVPAYTLADTLKGVVSQRLVRLLCPDCKKSRTLNDKNALDLLECEQKGHQFFISGSGCQSCMGTGSQGRAMVYELMRVDDSISDAISQRASPAIIRQMSLQNGMIPMSSKAAAMAREGLVDVQEALSLIRGYSNSALADPVLPDVPNLRSLPSQKLTIHNR
jgi:type IV pilus assembly protein PilB